MAKVFPLYISGSGKVTQTSSSTLIDHRYLQLSGSTSPYPTSLPYTYNIKTAASDATSTSNTVTTPFITFTSPARKEKSYYLTTAIVGASSTATAAAPQIGIEIESVGGGFSWLEHASGLSALQYRFYGTADTLTINTTAGNVSNADTFVPDHLWAVTENTSPSSSIINELVFQSTATNRTATLDSSTTYFSNEFFGVSSSIVPKNAPSGSLTISGSTTTSRYTLMKSGDTIDDAALPPTASLWVSQSTTVALTNNTSATYTNIFTLTGLVDGARYLVNFFLIGRSGATGTALHLRAQNANNFCGTFYIPNGTTTYTLQNSIDGTSIISAPNAGWPVANTDYLVRGAYTFTKAAGLNPVLDFKSESATTVTIQAESVIYYKRIDNIVNKELAIPLTLTSGSVSNHTQVSTLDRLGLNTNFLPQFITPNFKKIIKTAVSTSTSTAAANITDLSFTLENSKSYLIIYYIGASSSNTATGGIRIGVATANLTARYTVESPLTTTTVLIGHSATPATGTAPTNNLNNYYMYKIYALVTTNAAGTPTFTPTLATETNGVTVQVNDSLGYYVEY